MSHKPDWLSRTLPFCLLWIALCTSVCAEASGYFELAESQAISEIWVNPGFYSYHFQTDKGFNNSNFGLGLDYRYSKVSSVTVGGFYNSDRHTSHYAGWYWQPLLLGSTRLGVVIGGLDGYPKMRDGAWFLAAIPVASIEYQRVGMNLFFIPTYKGSVYGSVYGSLSFQLKLKLN